MEGWGVLPGLPLVSGNLPFAKRGRSLSIEFLGDGVIMKPCPHTVSTHKMATVTSRLVFAMLSTSAG